MRTKAEVQRVHDLFIPILTGEIPVKLDEDVMRLLTATTHVLCWVLEHDHKGEEDTEFPDFGVLAQIVEEAIKEQGFRLEDHGN